MFVYLLTPVNSSTTPNHSPERLLTSLTNQEPITNQNEQLTNRTTDQV